MKNISDVLTISFDSSLKDESALCVTRKYGGKTIMLKMELGEQADILYHLLTEQMTKAEIKTESEDKQKTGHWVEENINEWSRKVFCSECGCPPPFEHVSNGDVYSASGYGVINKTKYCPNCGIKMANPQESEDKCKNCKWRKDSDEVLRRGVSMEDLCAACYVRSNRK